MDFVREVRSIPLRLVAGRGHYETVVEAAIGALRSVWIATANLKDLMVEDARARPGRRRTAARGRAAGYRSMLEIFDELVGRGVEIRILHASLPSRPFREELGRMRNLGPQPALARSGRFTLRACPRVHLKTIIVDGALVYLGSANWTGAGLGVKGEGRRNFELGFVSRDDLLLDEVQAYYERIWQGAPCGRCKLRRQCPRPLDTLAV